MHEKNGSLKTHSFSPGELMALEEALSQTTPTSGIPYDQFKKEMMEFIAQGKQKHQVAELDDKKRKWLRSSILH